MRLHLGLHLGQPLRLFGGQVGALGRVVGQVKQPVFFGAFRDDQLPALVLQGAVGAVTPEQRPARLHRRLGAEKRQQVDAVNHPVGRQLATGGCQHRGQDVDVGHRWAVLQPSRDAARPFGHIGHAQAAFKKGQLPAAVRLVDLGQADVAGRAVVTGEDDDGVLFQPLFAQGLQHPAHAAVDRAHHGRVDAAPVVRDVGQRVVVFFGGLQWGVYAPVRQVHEEGLVFVALDGGDGLVGEVVGQVLVGLKPFAAVVAHAKAHVGPKEFVDGVEILFGIDHTRVFLRQVQATFHEQAFVKALVVGPHLGRAAQVPFADVDVVVALGFE